MRKFFNQYGWKIGFNPYRFVYFLRRLPSFWRDYKKLKKQSENSSLHFPFYSFSPNLFDKQKGSGIASGHYFHQDLYAASKIYHQNPERHIDVGSRIDGFVAHVATFREIEVADLRELTSDSENISYFKLDIMDEIPEEYRECTDSLSCLHVLEHLGLGRYGDDLQWDGYVTGFINLTNMLKSGGILYFSTPIGFQRVEFNAHRVFDLQTLLDLCAKNYNILEFSYVDDSGNMNKDVELREEDINNNFSCNYGCGIFQMQKI
jgi:hypothetical protein